MKQLSIRTLHWLAITGLLFSLWAHAGAVPKTEQWGVHEIMLPGPATGNPYLDVTREAEFKQGTVCVSVPGFCDGGGIYRIRFSPDRLGTSEFVTKSNRAELNGWDGSFECVALSRNNHGPLRIVNTFYLEYADGAPFYSVGTTAFSSSAARP